MFKSLRTLLSFVLLVSVYSLSAQDIPLTKITGTLHGVSNQAVRLIYNKVPFVGKPLEMRATTDDSGDFTLIFPIERRWPLDLTYSNSNLNIIISPGDSFHIDARLKDSVWVYELSGKGSEETQLNFNNYYEFDRMRMEDFQILVKTADLSGYTTTMKNWVDEYDKVLKSNLKETKADKELKKRAEALRDIKLANYFLIYGKYHKDIGDSSFKYPEEWVKVIEDKSLRELDYVPSSEYQNFLLLYLTQMGPEQKANPCETMQAYLNFSNSKFSKASKDEINARLLMEAMSNGCFKAVKEEYNQYLTYTSVNDYSAVLKQKAFEVDELSEGDMAPDFVFLDKEGNKHSLKDLRGKVIYLDFWATWCGPCIRSMKSSGPLKEAFKDNENVAFVYLSTDRDVNKWKSHYITNGGDKNHWHVGPSGQEVSLAYKVFSIPRYVIIDKEGKIVNPNAPRPYDPSLPEVLTKLANQPYTP